VDANRGVEAAAPPSGTVAFLFSDVEGSTRLLRELEADYAQLIDELSMLLRDAFEAHGGHVVDTQGDSFFVVFPRIRDAAGAAADAQRAIARHAWPKDVQVRVRIGLHVGEPLVADERYIGLGVHRAARLCAAAHGGEVVLSQAAGSLLADNLPPAVGLRDLGEHQLKDFDSPDRLFQLVVDGLPSDFAPLRTPSSARAAGGGLEFQILGPLEVLDPDRVPFQLGGRRQRAVLALLLLRRGEVVSTDRIVDALWGAEPPRTAITSLQNFVSQLRKLLGPERIVTRSPGYALDVSRDEVDADRFQRLVELGRDGEPTERAKRLREALAIWRGPALADFEYDAFARADIDRLEELRLVALEERVAADLELGRHAELVGELEAIVAEQPLRERLRGLLMLALYRSGRQADALAAYQQARVVLVEELGIDPSPSLQQLHGAILRQERTLDAVAETVADDHLEEVARAVLSGRLVPILGIDTAELAGRLADRFQYPRGEVLELTRVAQYAALMQGAGPLYDELAALLAATGVPGPVHRFFASLPPLLRERGLPHQLIVTTGYDLALEQAFLEAGEEFDVVSYLANGPGRGKFCHFAPNGDVRLIDVPNAYATELSLERRTVILKLHGGVDRNAAREWESFVVTEDDYIDYLGNGDVASAIPVAVAAKLRRSHLLFLGYGMREWNLRVVLGRVWGGEALQYRSWAVAPGARPVERQIWRTRGVDVVDLGLGDYVDGLGQCAGLAERTAA
jgi:DNA-binding SARP family transcriptional activator/class 3 adenylate cyclase